MKRSKNLLIVAAVFALLAVIGTVLNTRRVAAQGPPGGVAVNIVSPLPVPVTGATTVSGTVAATQSGTWNVGITGTPNVHVANTAAAPALTLDISKSASQHVELSCKALTDATGHLQVGCGLPSAEDINGFIIPYVVPAGQNFVLTSIDFFSIGGNGNFAFVGTNGFAVESWIVPNDGFTHSFPYPSGVVFPAGFTFQAPNVAISNLLSSFVNGYLTPI